LQPIKNLYDLPRHGTFFIVTGELLRLWAGAAGWFWQVRVQGLLEG
jgi:hypothetical protein